MQPLVRRSSARASVGSMILSTRFKEAFKIGLAMAIAYGISLSMGWDNPKWAGFAIVAVSQATVGQSLNVGVMRMLGTLIAAVVALTLIALFPQDRWAFMLALSAYIGFCTYMMGDARRQYFWFVSAFVCVIIALEAGPDAVDAFETAILRAEETGLGILVYSLLTVVLWPTNSRARFDDAVSALAETHLKLYRVYLQRMGGQGDPAEARSLRVQEVQQHARFEQLLDAALTDSYEVWEVRRQWRQYRRQLANLAATMELWRESFAEVSELDLRRLLPDLERFGEELDQRFAQMSRMLSGQPPERRPTAHEVTFDKTEIRALPHFQRAALAVTRARLQHLEVLTRALFDTVSDIKGYGRAAAASKEVSAAPVPFLFDPDRLVSVVRVMASLWLAFLALIYINDLPGGTAFVIVVTVFGMQLATAPQLPMSKLFAPIAIAVLFTGVLYVFVMPQFSTFAGLGGLIFAVTFGFAYLFAEPRQALARSVCLALFVMVIAVTNEQTYSFLAFANTALLFPLGFALLALTAYVPASPRPDHAFLRLLRRFFRSSEYLMTTMHWDWPQKATALDRWRRAFHAREMATLPRKVGTWARFINEKTVPGVSPPSVQALVTGLEGLSFRMHDLVDARRSPQADYLVEELVADVRVWRVEVQRIFSRVSEEPDAVEGKMFRARLTEILRDLEDRVETTLNKAGEGQIGTEDRLNIYRLLGAFRGVSEALINFSKCADGIDWVRWREARV